MSISSVQSSNAAAGLQGGPTPASSASGSATSGANPGDALARFTQAQDALDLLALQGGLQQATVQALGQATIVKALTDTAKHEIEKFV